MNKLAKLTTLAAALSVCSSPLLAGTFSVTSQTHSKEGVVGVSTAQASETITYTLGAAYTTNDTITFTFNEDILANTTFPSQINIDAIDSATPAEAIAGLALGFLNSSGSIVTYRVTSINQPDDTPGDGGTVYTDKTSIGAQLVFGSVSYTPSTVLTGDIKVSVASLTSNGGDLDSPATATLATSTTQFGSAMVNTPLDGVIDVAAERKAFSPVAADTLNWSISNPATTGWLNLATVNATAGTLVTLQGEDGRMAGVTAANFSVGGTGVVTVNEELEQALVTYGGDVASDSLSFTALTDDAAIVLNKQSFLLGVVYNYTAAGGSAGSITVGNGLEAGAWTINGSDVLIPYMPYNGTTTSQIIYVTNSGTQTGNISITAVDESAVKYDLGVISTAAAGSVTKIGHLIYDKMVALGFTKGKLAITVTVDVPTKDIIVYAAYNVGGSDRGTVNTDQSMHFTN